MSACKFIPEAGIEFVLITKNTNLYLAKFNLTSNVC